VTAEETTDLLALYDETAKAEGFEIGVRTTLQAILAAPSSSSASSSSPRMCRAVRPTS
jgi:hypothetical protein